MMMRSFLPHLVTRHCPPTTFLSAWHSALSPRGVLVAWAETDHTWGRSSASSSHTRTRGRRSSSDGSHT